MILLLRKYNLGIWKNVWCTYCNLPLPCYSSCSRLIVIKQLEKWTVNVRIWCVLMTCRSNFLKEQINHIFPAEKHIQPTEDLGVWLVIFPEHHPKVCSWGQLFSVVPGGCAFQQSFLRNAWYDCEHQLIPCQPADGSKHIYILEKDINAHVQRYVCIKHAGLFFEKRFHDHRRVLSHRTRLAGGSKGL